MFNNYIIKDINGYYIYKPKKKRKQEHLLKVGKIDSIKNSQFKHRITNWLFKADKVQRFFKKDGTFEDRLIGTLKVHYGNIGNQIADYIENFILTPKMLQNRYIHELYPGTYTECPRRELSCLKSYIWGQAIRFCEVETFKDCSDAEIKKSLAVFKPNEKQKVIRTGKKRRRLKMGKYFRISTLAILIYMILKRCKSITNS